MLRRNVTFLKTGQKSIQRDEYTLMLETAEKLGVHISVAGKLPPSAPQKHVIATAIHECITNTLRHAHGDNLHIQVTDREGWTDVTFTNNGTPPSGPVQEKGGLSSLRRLAEQAGGHLAFSAAPHFSMTLSLPKEVPHGLQGIDRG